MSQLKNSENTFNNPFRESITNSLINGIPFSRLINMEKHNNF